MAEVEGVLQVRKQYTITKPREKWLEEEHNKFLEAVQLHGRAWRLIEEHIGTKTAVQIRSHAQKFASKMAKDANDSRINNLKPFKIPPPRPKKKPTHPYPRKQIHSEHVRLPSSAGLYSVDMLLLNNPNDCASPVDLQPELNHHENEVHSAKNSVEEDDMHLSLSLAFPGITAEDGPNLELNLNSSIEQIHSRKVPSSEPKLSAFKLFGKTMMLSDSYKQLPAIAADADHRSFQENVVESNCNAIDSDSGKPDEEPINEGFPMNGAWFVGFTPSCYYLPATVYATEPNTDDEAQVVPTSWFSFYSNTPLPSAHTPQLTWSTEDLNQTNLQNECSGTGSNTGHGSANAVKSMQDECGDDEEGFSVVLKSRKTDDGSAGSCNKGFVPYRRCDSGEKVKCPSSAGESVGDS